MNRAPRDHRGRHAKKEWLAKARNHPRIASAPHPQAHCDFTASRLIRNSFAVRERMGRLSDDGPRQHDLDPSEGP
jgi:hypothetical protein